MTNPAARIAMLLALVIVAILGMWHWRLHPSAASPGQVQSPVATAAVAAAATSARREIAMSPTTAASSVVDANRTPGLPASLQGTTPDGEVTLNAQGRIVPTAGLRRLFDYFLSVIGELDVPAIRALLVAHVQGLHDAHIAHEAGLIFDRYVDYQRALGDAEPLLSPDLDARLAFATRLRRKFFDAASADAYFGEEEAYADYTLQRMRIARDASLDETERADRLQALEQTLAPEQRASLREASTALLAEEQSRQLDAINASPGDRQAERSALFGAEAANRLADLDRERLAWDQRIAAYQQARDAIRADSRYSAAQRQRLTSELLAHSFDSNEARRVAALESIGKL